MTDSIHKKLCRVALTGGIGSGKSAAALEFQKLGAAIIDSDEISHQITSAQGAAIPQIRSTFGDEFIDAHGALSRIKMRELVFNDPHALGRLEKITHPLIKELAEKTALSAEKQNPSYLIFMIPLLFESSNWQGRFQKIIVVDCSVEQQIERVMSRNQMSRESVLKIIHAQVSRETRLANADYVVSNDDSWEKLRAQVKSIDHDLRLSFDTN